MKDKIGRNDAVKKVVVVGGGTAGWITASSLAKLMGSLLEIEVVESDEIGIVGVGEATIPQIQIFNGIMEIDEADFMRATHGTYKLGIEFLDWGAIGRRYMHAFGDVGRDLARVHFQHYWLRHRLNGGTSDLWDYSLNYSASKQSKFAHQKRNQQSALPFLAYAYHFDAALYAVYLRGICEKLGVKRTEGKIVDVNLRSEDGFVESLSMENGDKIEGDLFVDCSGFKGLLIEQALNTGYEDWSHWLPVDRALAVPCDSVEPLTPYTRSTAHTAGWQWRIPLQHRIGNGHVFCSEYMSEDEATSILMNNLDGAAQAEPRLIKFKTGRRKKFWNKNCVAMGLACGFMEPLESTSIHLIQTSVSRMISLFPDKGFSQANIDEYNRQTNFEFERIRDFIILHYKASTRDDSEFWRHCRDMSVPDELTYKMDLFKATGRIYKVGDELFHPVGWLQVMSGQGIMPEAYNPMANQLSDAQLEEFLDSFATIIRNGVKTMPDHAAFVAGHCAVSE